MSNEFGGISKREVAEAYLRAEITKGTHNIQVSDLRTLSEKPLHSLSIDKVFELLNLFSNQVRKNSVHRYVTDESFTWQLKQVPTDKLFLTGVNAKVNPILESCNFNLMSFSTYLTHYFENNPYSDPLGLNEFVLKPQFELLNYPLIAIQDGRINIIDGMHRAVAQTMRGKTHIDLYVGNRF